MTTNEITPPNTQSRWSRFYQKFISAHPSIQLQEERYKAELLSALSLVFSIIILGGSLATILFSGFSPLIIAGALFGVASFATYIMSRGQLYKRAPLLFISSFALLAYTASLIGDYPALFLVLTFAILFLLSNLLELKELIWSIAINATLALLISAFIQLEGQEALNARAGVFSIGLFVILFAWYRENLGRLRLEEINSSRKEAENLNTELQQTSQYLELAIEVSQKVSVVQDVDLMLAEAANIIRDRFEMYYTQIYLTDRSERNLILRAGTGQVGEKLLNRAHRLSIDMSSINGTVATQRRAVIVEDTETSRIHRPNPLLPDTRSEMAVPLMAQDRVVGVLDLQSAEAGALNEENLSAFEALAGQLAIAIVNAELFAEVEEARAQIETRSAQATKEGWKDYLDAIERKDRIAYSYENENITPLVEVLPPASDEKTLVVPIDVAGAEIGALQFEGKQAWDKSDAIFASVIAEQVALQVENIRLLEQSQQYQNEAQEALRRLTREAWEGYQKEESLAYIYKDAQVQALEDDPFEEKESYEIKISNEAIGQINIARHETLSAEDAELAASITEQLSAHLEKLRLSSETEKALSETESLYTASRSITAAQNAKEVAENLVAHIDRQKLDRVLVALIDDKEKEMLKADVLALWDRAGVLEAGNSFTDKQIPLLNTLGTQDSLFIDDFANTEKVDDVSKATFAYLGVKSAAIIPISVGETLLGWLLLEATDNLRNFSTEDMSSFNTLAGQVAVVLESQRLLEETQRRAQREQALSEITTAVRTSSNPQTILKTAVRELGNIFGRQASIHLAGTERSVKQESAEQESVNQEPEN